jgi:hypothetical protein
LIENFAGRKKFLPVFLKKCLTNGKGYDNIILAFGSSAKHMPMWLNWQSS